MMEAEKKMKLAASGCGFVFISCLLLAGIVTTIGGGIICGTGYFLAGICVTISSVVIKRFQVAKDLENSVSSLEHENGTLRDLNADLESNNKELEQLKNGLQDDIEIVTQAVKSVGDSTENFMQKLKTNYDKLKSENDRHQKLNREQGIFQLMQLFKDFDSDKNFLLNKDELKRNEPYLKAMFPSSQLHLIEETNDSPLTFQNLVDIVMPNSKR